MQNIRKLNIKSDYDLYAYLFSKTVNYKEAKLVRKELEKLGLELNIEMYNILFELADNFTDGKRIINQMKRHRFKIDPMFHQSVIWKKITHKEQEKAIKYTPKTLWFL